MRTLVVENNPKLNRLISAALIRDGFKVDPFFSLEDAVIAVKNVKTYRIAVLDLEPFNDTTVSLLREICRQSPKTIILATSMNGALNNRIKILDTGVDDLLIKPFQLSEMSAHCRALFRRAGGKGDQENFLTAGNIRINPTTYEFYVDDTRVHLTKREINLLTQLVRRFNQIVTKSSLMDSLFAFSDSPTPNGVEALVYRLRRRLSALNTNIEIRTEHGIGYCLCPIGER